MNHVQLSRNYNSIVFHWRVIGHTLTKFSLHFYT